MLSDDVFRFQWDAQVVSQGLSPYSFLPNDLLGQDGFSLELYSKLNSQVYYSVYPPTMQWFFLAVSGLFSIANFVFGIKFLCFACEVLLFIYIRKYLSRSGGLKLKFEFVSLLPLVVLEGIGNLHFEVLMMYLFFCAYVLLQDDKYTSMSKSGGVFAISVLTKLTVAPLVVLFVRRTKGFIWLIVAFLLSVTVLSFPLLDAESMNTFSSFGLYFSSFEFNASLYYIVRALAFGAVGYNVVETYGMVFKMILVLFGLLVLIQAFRFNGQNQKKLLHWLNAFFLLYCLGNPTLHPWYLIVPLFLSVFTSSYFWIIWSVTIYFSYFFYTDFVQIGLWLYVEYGALLLIYGMVELVWKKRQGYYALFAQG
jgi:hypothetical protein